MSHKQLNTALELNVTAETVVSEKASGTITEDYQKLNDKIDKVISKIKGRKDRKNKK